MAKTIKVTKESPTGLNKEFYDPNKGKTMNRGEFANEITKGNYPDYHLRTIQNGNQKLRIPVSNPDKSKNNNLG